jgi:hypothetical protein
LTVIRPGCFDKDEDDDDDDSGAAGDDEAGVLLFSVSQLGGIPKNVFVR